MSRWFRHYAGMMRDEKLVRASIKSKQPIERVVWVWGCILESAAEIDDGGRYEIDHAEMAYFLRADESDLAAVEDALRALGRVDEGAVAHWKDRQFQSDRSAERQKRYRERHQGTSDGDQTALRDAGVTSPSRNRDAPETETETELETEVGAKAPTPRKRATRIPENWVPDEVFAAREGMSAEHIRREADGFRDYWRGVPGQRGVKADWDATWRNWVRKRTGAASQPQAGGYDWDRDPANRGVL